MDSNLLHALTALYALESRQQLRLQGIKILLETQAFSEVSINPKPCIEHNKQCLDLGAGYFFNYLPSADKQQIAEALTKAFRSQYLACHATTQTHALEQIERLSHVGYWRWHVSENRVFYSPQWKAMLGYEDNEIKSDFSAWENLLHPDDRAEAERQVAYFFSHPHATNIVEFRLQCKNGQYRTIISKGRVESLQADNQTPDIIFGIHFPADELKGSQEDHQRLTTQLNRERTLRARAGEIADIGFWEVNLDTGYIYWNKKTRLIHGVDENYKPDLETAIEFYKAGYSRDTITQAVQTCLEHGTPYDVELEIVDIHGNEKWVRAIGIKDDSSDELRMFGLFQDVDQRKRAISELEQARHAAEEANRAKSVFLASMSHELRTPMNGVLGMLQLMEGSVKQEVNKRRLQIASNSAKNLLTILDDILDFSRIEAGKLVLDSTEFSMSELLSSLQELFNIEVEKKRSTIHIENLLQHDMYWGDEGRIRQMLINLIGNANKFTQNGQIIVRAQSGENRDLKLSVQDTGIGIPSDRLGQIFESFTQADSSTTRQYGGSGLGLTICKRLSELMNGTISVISEQGKGSEFTLHLPLREAECRQRTDQNVTFLPPVLSLDKSNILLVEDNEINQIVVSDMLKDLDAQIEICNNGKEAIDFLQSTETQFDCVLMDCQMPVMDGYEATCAIRRGVAGEAWTNVPIIALTANAMHGDKEKCLDAGMSDYLSKPVDMSDLQKAISPFLKIK
ncbi:response regulator [Bermanella marisrubri]|uniref:Sensory/regulatory protein RpfC n=1 Tax=Bermanella marisrubri TaxID=207949 RepID=Q1MZA1_9GAMM|nr:PAS domain-containing hybrid sensor histidine kinase/response regulator [Bermanella marisrubri]EAT11365.1 sensory transduction histidine kinase [Oceanobacter sp. RED65] [Bermanella marisrubri]QIZ85249.1 response regulator [Bermanella marisrubri]